MDRRTFIEAGLALPAVSLVPSLGVATRALAAETLVLERLVYDPRFDEAFAVARRAEQAGLATTAVADDLMALWYDELDLLWREAPRALAGVTLAEALFVLETLAMDRGMRVVFRAEHRAVEQGRIEHRFAGPAALVERLAALPDQADWPAELARALTACPLGAPEPAEAELVTRAPGLSLRDETLHSWIIAPRTAVALTLPS